MVELLSLSMLRAKATKSLTRTRGRKAIWYKQRYKTIHRASSLQIVSCIFLGNPACSKNRSNKTGLPRYSKIPVCVSVDSMTYTSAFRAGTVRRKYRPLLILLVWAWWATQQVTQLPYHQGRHLLLGNRSVNCYIIEYGFQSVLTGNTTKTNNDTDGNRMCDLPKQDLHAWVCSVVPPPWVISFAACSFRRVTSSGSWKRSGWRYQKLAIPWLSPSWIRDSTHGLRSSKHHVARSKIPPQANRRTNFFFGLWQVQR